MRAAAATLKTLPRAAFSTLPRVALALPPRLRRRLIVALAVTMVLAVVYMVWLRDSSLVQVEKVTVTGLTAERAPEIRAALTRAARDMTTLHVDEDALLRAVGSEPLVHSLSTDADFPHGLKIEVTENVPRALLVGAGRRVAVAGNGVVLSGLRVEGNLPVIKLVEPPARGRVGNPSAAELVRVAGAAPIAIVSRLTRITRQPGKGIVAQVRRGPVIYFGDTSRIEAKWAEAAAILADRGSHGAAYVDVRMPGRPVAGGLQIDVAPSPEDGAHPPGTPGAEAPDGPPGAGAGSPGAGVQTPGAAGQGPGAAGTAPAPTAPAPGSTSPAGPQGAAPAPGAGTSP
jgi:cell division protein FtsQ